jgi:uncharacterized short protein YbdD (DUF466 family)
MRNVLAFWGAHHESTVFDTAIDYIKNGDNVFLLCCDNTAGICIRNYLDCPSYCSVCRRSKKEALREYIPDFKNFHFVAEYVTKEIVEEAQNYHIQYSSTKELKDITYKGIEIGFGAYSTYVTLTRHCNPLYSKAISSYIDDILRMEIRLILVGERVINKFNPDLIIFHNGRFAQYKPFLGLTQKEGIDFIVSEVIQSQGGAEIPNNFYNDIPHSILMYQYQIERDWNNADPDKRVKIAKEFYENRRNAKYSGDKIYSKDQQLGLLPDGWDKSKENIVIFNSSEDEYVSISKAYDDGRLFKTQYEGLKTLFEHYKDDNSRHFYLRIHPNLTHVDDISHLALYKLKYGNVTIIPPSSPISTYTLIDNSSKVVVFNSTVGIESIYWGKPVIALDTCAYKLLDVVYSPSSTREIFELLETADLKYKYNEGVLKYAYWLLGMNYPKQKYLHNVVTTKYLFGRPMGLSTVFRLFGSIYIYALANFFFLHIFSRFKCFAKFNKVPVDRDLWGMANVKSL